MKRTAFLPAAVSLMACAALAFLPACEKEEPTTVYDPGAGGSAAPVITSVDPAGSAFGGVTEVTLNGQNFSSVDTANVVYFGNRSAAVLSASPTRLVVLPPDTDATGLTISVAVPGAYAMAQFGPYKLERASVEYGGFKDLDQVYSIALDASENLYAQLKDTAQVNIVPPNGTGTKYGKLAGFPKASDMKIGPGGYLYLQQTNSTSLHRMDPGGGTTSLYVTLPGKASAIDFDSSGNIFAGGAGAGLFVVNPNKATREVGSYRNKTIKSIRVFSGYVYVAVSAPQGGIWRNKILTTAGALDTNQLYYDWTKAPGTFSAAPVKYVAIAEDGDLYVGTDNTDPILLVHPDGSAETLYPSVLKPPLEQLVWGPSTYLYQNRYSSTVPSIRRVIKIGMGKKGAPDFGWK